jgi:D-cysteine desulfhydrase family pyridoxal phosphate-dependent enzyme
LSDRVYTRVERRKMKTYRLDELKAIIGRFPRVKLTCLPTPVYLLENLTRELAGPEIMVKRDDLTGLAFGGNKSRKLEFIIADALRKDSNTIITWGSLQSNWCLQVAAASRKYGLNPVLVLFRTYDLPVTWDGNILVEKLLEADIQVRGTEEKGKCLDHEKAFRVLQEVAEVEKQKGLKPYLVSIGGSLPGGDMDKPLGALAYFEALLEIYEQTVNSRQLPDHIFIASGSGATQAGLLVAAKALGLRTRISGICVSDKKEDFLPAIKQIALELVEIMELELELKEDEIILFDEYLGLGYGQVTEEVSNIIKFLLNKEGLVLDPVYTSKVMVGLVDLVRKKYFSANDRVLFIHTGGSPALFAFKEKLVKYPE